MFDYLITAVIPVVCWRIDSPVLACPDGGCKSIAPPGAAPIVSDFKSRRGEERFVTPPLPGSQIQPSQVSNTPYRDLTVSIPTQCVDFNTPEPNKT